MRMIFPLRFVSLSFSRVCRGVRQTRDNIILATVAPKHDVRAIVTTSISASPKFILLPLSSSSRQLAILVTHPFAVHVVRSVVKELKQVFFATHRTSASLTSFPATVTSSKCSRSPSWDGDWHRRSSSHHTLRRMLERWRPQDLARIVGPEVNTFSRTSTNFFTQTNCHRLCRKHVFHSITGGPNHESSTSTSRFSAPVSALKPVVASFAQLSLCRRYLASRVQATAASAVAATDTALTALLNCRPGRCCTGLTDLTVTELHILYAAVDPHRVARHLPI